MAQLFNKNLLKKAIENYKIENQTNNLELIKQWLDMHKSGFLASKTETESEQAFNDSFFVQILGYQAIPNNPFTIDPKGKNEISGQKADAILGYFTTDTSANNLENVQAVVEVKDSKTLLDKPQRREGNLSPVQQGFKYKPQYSNCKWVIISNFYEIRLYKDTMLDYEIWNLEQLLNPANEFENFRTFHYLLSAKNLISASGESNTERLLSIVRQQQEKITKEFYAKYKKLRFELINDIKHNNPSIGIETVITKAQKIIDRLVFVFFCEDRDLLPQGKVEQYIKKAREMDFTPWDLLKKVFKGVDKGSEMLEIPKPGYNGGLFAPDEELEKIEVSDIICHKFLELGIYDFQEEISINVLGHIFEQSISDLEELKIDMLGTVVGTGELGETTKHSKRKKDGIFYTPEYIVDYIVRNSVGKYLEEKETELKDKFGLKEDIQDKNYEKRIMQVYQEYQQILQNIKVLDPACGSGAFLVKVYDYLYNENKRVIELLSGGKIGLFDKDRMVKDILQNNIYGVDLNEESVEITKLSLWLKTAEKGKQLADLDKNIKCGNSLIDDESVAGKKTFKREIQFNEIMKNGGFHIVAGNPPYVRVQNLDEKSRGFFGKNYKTAYKNYDIYLLFVEKANFLLKKGGFCGFIMPKKFVNTDYGMKLKEFIYDNNFLEKFIDFGFNQIFEDATTYTGIFIFKKDSKKTRFEYSHVGKEMVNLDLLKYNEFNKEDLKNEAWVFLNESGKNLYEKLSKKTKLVDFTDKIFQGLVTGIDGVFVLEVKDGKLYSKQTCKAYDFNNDIVFPLLKGAEIKRYTKPQAQYKIIYPYHIKDNKAEIIPENIMKTQYVDVYDYLKESESILRQREKGKFNNDERYSYSRNQNIAMMPFPKILTQVLSKRSSITIDDSGEFFFVGGGTAGGYGITLKNEVSIDKHYLLALLNSRLLEWYLHNYASPFSGGYYAYSRATMEKLPIMKADEETQNKLKDVVLKLISLNNELQDFINESLGFFSKKFGINKLSTKLGVFWTLAFVEFIKELKIKKLGLEQEREMMSMFEKDKEKIIFLMTEIDKIDGDIDNVVFDLYGLNDEERRIVLGW